MKKILTSVHIPIRPSLNIDINRNACTFKNPKDLLAFIDAMKKHPVFGLMPGILCPCNMFGPNDFEIVRRFLLLVRIKNMFLFDEGRAEKQFHYRTVMMNWLFTPNMTYQELAAKSVGLWNQYLDYESVSGFGSKDPSESWGTWCVNRPGEGKRIGFIWMFVYYYVCYNPPSNFHPGGIRSRSPWIT